MSSPVAPPPVQTGAAVPFWEFVALTAALMAINALGIDTMLPALPAMAGSLGLSHENQQQWIISSYMLGMGTMQIVYGPLADRFGRRPVTLFGLGLFAAMSLFASFATSFEAMIVARVLQGTGAACTRVLSVAMVRDSYSGRQMARVMSLSFMIFLAVPMLAPAVGQLILTVAPWPGIFYVLGGLSAAIALWLGLRLGETLHPEYRRSIDLRQIAAGWRMVLTNRTSLGYTLGLTCSFGALTGFITSAQQLFSVTFDAQERFPLIFAFVASAMGFAAFVNSRVVVKLGTRMVSHTALLVLITIGAVHLVTFELFGDSLTSFVLFQFAVMFCAGLLGSNFGAMAMEPMGAIAGTASSLQGAVSTAGGALFGIAIGQNFDGTPRALIMGYFLCGLLMLAAVLFAERGRMFRAHHSPQG
ncbi:MAG: multidrug effflux MFS transporter [Sphingobium sp.]